MAIVETDLGWAAEEDYLVYDAGEYLCYMESPSFKRTFTKAQTGYAIAAFVHSTTSGWYGPYLISDVRNYANYITQFSEGSGDIVITPGYSVRHYKRTWYINEGYHLQAEEYTTTLPVFETALENASEIAMKIMEMAGLQLYRTDKTWSFLAGMMCGLSGQALPKIGV